MSLFNLLVVTDSGLPLLYIDPGTGSIILQALLAGVAGAFVFMKYHGRRVAFRLGFKRRKDDADQTESE